MGERVCDGLAVGVAANEVATMEGNVAAEVGPGVCTVTVDGAALPVGGGLFPPAQAARIKNNIQAKGSVRFFILSIFFNP